MQKFFHFLTLTDSEEMQQCGRYDHHLMYASVLRQLISVVFSFSVFMYGSLMFLPFEHALLVSVLVSLTLFTIDQAIIGAEWSLPFTFFRQSWANYWVNLIYLPLRLLPRIIFSVAIAYVIATLAEISLQHKAIDEVLQKEMRGLNSEYFQRVEAKESVLNTSLVKQQADIQALQTQIDNKQRLFASFNQDNRVKDEASMNQHINQAATALNKKQALLESKRHDKKRLSAKLAEQQSLLAHWEAEKALELSPDRGATKGRRWHKAHQKTIHLGLSIGLLKAELVKLEALLAIYAGQVADSQHNSQEIQSFRLSMAGASLPELKQKKAVAEQQLMHDKEIMQTALLSFKQGLKTEGLFFAMKDGPLGRYIALSKLYDDVDYGAAAKEFSYGLKVVIILVELSPVLVMVFFSPYSFYAEKMRVKKHGIESVIPTLKLKAETQEAKKQSSLLREEKDQQRSKKFDEVLDEQFNEAFESEFAGVVKKAA